MVVFASLMLLCFTAVLFAREVYAEDLSSDIVMAEGAAVRYENSEEEIDKSGIRFDAYVSESYKAANEGATYGMLFLPAEMLGAEEELIADTANAVNQATEVWRTASDKEGYDMFSTVLYGIPESGYGTVIAARAYILNEGVYTYSDVQKRSIAQVASMALAAGDEHTKELNAYVDGALKEENGGSFTIPETLTLGMGFDAALEVSVSPAELVPTYASENEKIVTVTKDGTVTAVGEGTANIVVTLGTSVKKTAVTVAESGLIFNPTAENMTSQIKTSTSCPMEFNAGDPTAAYTGDYVSFTSTEARWHNIYLTPKFELETYEKYDLVEVWLYADAADGTEVSFSFFNNTKYNYRFTSDTWTKITIDMEDFVTEMGKNNAIFLPFNTNNPNSTNHVSLTELRLGGVFAKYAVNYTVGEEKLNIEAGAEETEVALTVSSDRETMPAFTLTLTKDNQVIQPSKTEGNVYTYVLGAGSYEYKVVSTDEMYRGETTGTFIVDYATKIELPAAENAVAGVAYDIPEATVYVNGEATSEKATVTASFTAKYTNEKTSGISVKGYVAPSSGIIEVVYTYEGAISKSMTITVERGAVSQNHALDFTSSDVLENIQVAGGNNILTYVSEGDGAPYVSWTIKDNAKASWQMFKVSASVSADVLSQYDYVKVKAMALSDDGVYRWRALMCSDQYIAGDSAWDAPTRLALNEWGYIYIPMSAFISGGNGFDKKCFVSVTFNSPKDGNADNVKEVRFADFELIKAAEGEIVADKIIYTAQENPSFTVSVTPELGYKVEIRQNGETIATLEQIDGKYVWEGNKAEGKYEAVIVLTENGYKLDGDFSVAVYFSEIVDANVIFDPTAENMAAQIASGTTFSMEVKPGDPDAAYSGDYVSFTTTTTGSKWHNIGLTAKSALETYSIYDVVEIWLYADAADGTEVGFSFFNNLTYNYRFMSDTWTKITIDMDDFIAQMSVNSAKFLPFNTNNPNSTNHASLTELRLGAIYAK